MTVAEIARVIWEECGLDPDAFALDHLPTFEVDVVRRWPDVSKARDLLGWEAKIGVRQGIRQTVDWLRTQVGPSGQ
jgi:nucleoside-diphosphate-sugar epimerase